MLIRFLSFVFFSFYSVFVFSQINKDSISENKVVYTFDLFRASQGSMQINREVYISPKRTLVFGLIGTYASTKGIAKPYLKAQSFEYTNTESSITYNLEDVQALGLGVNLKSKKYLKTHCKNNSFSIIVLSVHAFRNFGIKYLLG